MDMSGQLLVSRPSTSVQPLQVACLDVNRREAKDENRNEPLYTQNHTKTKPNACATGVILAEQIHSVVDPHHIHIPKTQTIFLNQAGFPWMTRHLGSETGFPLLVQENPIRPHTLVEDTNETER